MANEQGQNEQDKQPGGGQPPPLAAVIEMVGEIGKLATALAQVQGALKPMKKNATADVVHAKGRYSYGYMTLGSTLEAVLPLLSDAGLALVQLPTMAGGDVLVTTLLLHAESGAYIRSTMSARPVMPYPPRDKPDAKMSPTPQAIGSVITYLRRYSAWALIGIAPEDDDGKAASGGGRNGGGDRRDFYEGDRAPGGQNGGRGGSAPDLISEDQTKKLWVVMREYYADTADKMKPEMAGWASGGDTERFSELTTAQASKAIKELETRIRDRDAADQPNAGQQEENDQPQGPPHDEEGRS